MKLSLLLIISLTSLITAQKTFVIDVSNFSFNPKNIVIELGDTVKWNLVQGSHSTTSDITSGENSWDKHLNNANPIFKKVLTKVGVYSYKCPPHVKSGMAGTITVIDPLPVELSSFLVKVVEKNIILKWSTATETNNYGFEVQRSEIRSQMSDILSRVEESNTVGQWEKIGFVRGSGNSTVLRQYSFIDDKVSSSGIFSYRLKQIDIAGTYNYSSTQSVQFNLADEFNLEQNFPNPFNPSTIIKFQIANSGIISLKIYNAIGKEVALLVNELKQPGKYEVEFNLKNIDGGLPSGIYYYVLKNNGFVSVRKMIALK